MCPESKCDICAAPGVHCCGLFGAARDAEVSATAPVSNYRGPTRPSEWNMVQPHGGSAPALSQARRKCRRVRHDIHPVDPGPRCQSQIDSASSCPLFAGHLRAQARLRSIRRNPHRQWPGRNALSKVGPGVSARLVCHGAAFMQPEGARRSKPLASVIQRQGAACVHVRGGPHARPSNRRDNRVVFTHQNGCRCP